MLRTAPLSTTKKISPLFGNYFFIMTLQQIKEHELQKIIHSVRALVPIRPNTSKPDIFQFADSVKLGIVSKFEAREALKSLGQPTGFPVFN